jgi:HK97 family phage major capsid protein
MERQASMTRAGRFDRLGSIPQNLDSFTPREETRMAHDFSTTLRAALLGNEAPKSLMSEVAADVRARARLAEAPAGVISIPTGARLWSPGAVDLRHQQRDASTAGTGAYLVATQNLNFIELLRNRMVAFQMGATRLAGLVGNVTIPKQTAGATAYWLSTETTPITEGNQTFAQVALTPRTVAAYTQISRLIQLQSNPDIDSVVGQDLARQVAIAADAACLNGTGTEQPTGIVGTASVGTFDGSSADLGKMLAAQTDLASANALTGSSGYVTTPVVAGALASRAEFSGSLNPVWRGSILDGTIGGLRAMSSQQIPTGYCVFGDFSSLLIGEWGVLDIEINRNDDFARGITGIRAMFSMDCCVRTPSAFSVASSMS